MACEFPCGFTDTVEVSFLVQYFAGRGRSVRHAQSVAKLFGELQKCAEQTKVSFEILVNNDSGDVRDGDVDILVPALGPSGFMILAPNIGETRGYNNLARMSRGRCLSALTARAVPLPSLPVLASTVSPVPCFTVQWCAVCATG